MDVCPKVEFSPEQLARAWAADTGGTNLLRAAVAFIQAAYNSRGRLRNPAGAQFNDVPAMAYAIDPSLFDTVEAFVRVEHSSPLTAGQTVADIDGVTDSPPNARVAMEVDADRLTELWVSRVGGAS